MSYCRTGKDSDVYMFGQMIFGMDGGLVCCNCLFVGNFGSKMGMTKEEALKHLKKHIEKGHKVPDYAIERLCREIEQEEK